MTDKKSNKIKEIFESDNFMQDIIILKNRIYGAGYNGLISKKNI